MSVLPESRFNIMTIAVADREMMTAFYTDTLGLTCFNTQGMTMFDMGGLVLGLWERDNFAEDAGRSVDAPSDFPGFALAYNARSREEVDTIFGRLEKADVAVTRAPHDTFWGGYGGYFADPEGNPWEVAYNPHWPVLDDGRLGLPSKKGQS